VLYEFVGKRQGSVAKILADPVSLKLWRDDKSLTLFLQTYLAGWKEVPTESMLDFWRSVSQYQSFIGEIETLGHVANQMS